MKKNSMLFGPESVVAEVVSEKLKAGPPFTYALNSPVELRVINRSDTVPFVKAPALLNAPCTTRQSAGCRSEGPMIGARYLLTGVAAVSPSCGPTLSERNWAEAQRMCQLDQLSKSTPPENVPRQHP